MKSKYSIVKLVCEMFSKNGLDEILKQYRDYCMKAPVAPVASRTHINWQWHTINGYSCSLYACGSCVLIRFDSSATNPVPVFFSFNPELNSAKMYHIRFSLKYELK